MLCWFRSWSRLKRTQVLSLLALGGGFSYSASHSPAVLSGSQRGGCDVYSSCFDCVADAACGFCPGPTTVVETTAQTAGEGGTGAVSGGEVTTVTGYCIAGSAAAPVTAGAAGGGATAMCAVRIRLAEPQRFFNTQFDTLSQHKLKLGQTQDERNESRTQSLVN